MAYPKKPWQVRFWRQVKKRKNGCWIWIGARDKNGYGVFENEGRHHAYRFLWEQLNGPVQKGLCVSHKCNVQPCVNPAHLHLQSHAANMAYKMACGRWSGVKVYNRWVRPMRRTLFHRFWKRVKKTNTCWLWTGSLNGDGYGTFSFYGPIIAVHRVVWMLLKSEIPQGMNVLHTCDVRNCVNPNHLYLGTQKDNRRDADVRGRTNLPKGASHPRAKLTDEQVLEIRRLYKPWYFTTYDLAKKFGVGRTAIISIVDGKSWKHLLPLDKNRKQA